MNSKDEVQMKAVSGKLSFILNTVSAFHEIAPYLSCLEKAGALVYVGILFYCYYLLFIHCYCL